MTPRLRTRCAIAVASLLLVAHPAQADESGTPEASPSVRPTASSSLAGRPAGEGRPRPGRPLPPVSVSPSTPSVSAKPSLTPSGTPSATRSASVSASPSASAPPSRRHHHPPRPRLTEEEEPWTEEHEEDAEQPAPPPTPFAPAAARQQQEQAAPEAVARQISPLSLGIGMALMGLGIGFLAVRMRRR
ncbi:hypothetical protein [Streptomyces sp. NPDC008141]|uniref:hypothetical protein n=1 Tax=Streptomyces sp. NPDC008141 TaxID=3364815 RepID=UPI0036E432AE